MRATCTVSFALIISNYYCYKQWRLNIYPLALTSFLNLTMISSCLIDFFICSNIRQIHEVQNNYYLALKSTSLYCSLSFSNGNIFPVTETRNFKSSFIFFPHCSHLVYSKAPWLTLSCSPTHLFTIPLLCYCFSCLLACFLPFKEVESLFWLIASEVQFMVSQLHHSGPEVRQSIMAEGHTEQSCSSHDGQEAEITSF